MEELISRRGRGGSLAVAVVVCSSPYTIMVRGQKIGGRVHNSKPLLGRLEHTHPGIRAKGEGGALSLPFGATAVEPTRTFSRVGWFSR